MNRQNRGTIHRSTFFDPFNGNVLVDTLLHQCPDRQRRISCRIGRRIHRCANFSQIRPQSGDCQSVVFTGAVNTYLQISTAFGNHFCRNHGSVTLQKNIPGLTAAKYNCLLKIVPSAVGKHKFHSATNESGRNLFFTDNVCMDACNIYFCENICYNIMNYFILIIIERPLYEMSRLQFPRFQSS